MKKLLISLAVAAVSAGAASAQTAFDGGYYGFGLGYGRADVSNFDGTGSLKLGGPVASGFVGWNLSSGNVVYGGEADLSYGGSMGPRPVSTRPLPAAPKFRRLGPCAGVSVWPRAIRWFTPLPVWRRARDAGDEQRRR